MAVAANDTIDQAGTSASTLSTWAAPYVTDMLGQAQVLGNKEFQPYDGARVAGFSPLQNQAFSGYAGMQTPSQFGIATNLANQLAGQLGGVNPRSFTDQGIASLYMSPYQQQVIDINKREAMRMGDIQNQASAAQAVGKGAFGGYRHGLVEAENQRNMQQRLADIQDKGMQDAFSQAQRQFNVEDALRVNSGLQGITAGTGIAGLLNNIGYGQGTLGLSQLRELLAAGNTQQANDQKGLDADYNDYLTQFKFPYQQLQFQRDMLQGLPISTTTNSTQYAPPSSANAYAGLVPIVGGILADNYGQEAKKP